MVRAPRVSNAGGSSTTFPSGLPTTCRRARRRRRVMPGGTEPLTGSIPAICQQGETSRKDLAFGTCFCEYVVLPTTCRRATRRRSMLEGGTEPFTGSIPVVCGSREGDRVRNCAADQARARQAGAWWKAAPSRSLAQCLRNCHESSLRAALLCSCRRARRRRRVPPGGVEPFTTPSPQSGSSRKADGVTKSVKRSKRIGRAALQLQACKES